MTEPTSSNPNLNPPPPHTIKTDIGYTDNLAPNLQEATTASFTTAMELAQQNGIALENPIGIEAICLFLFRHFESPFYKRSFDSELKTLIKKLLTQVEKIPATLSPGDYCKVAETQANKFIKKLSENHFLALGPKSQAYLKDKILGVILYEGIESQAREEILSMICKDFFNLCSTANERVRADLRLGKLAYLGLEASDTIKEIGPLGDESHNNGHVALFITFRTSTGDKTIVYKPRSMLPEKLICDEKVGIMGHVGFGSYKVIDCNQDKFGEKYGYCEFLENDIIKNTIDSFEELQEYERKMCVLQKIAESLGISQGLLMKKF